MSISLHEHVDWTDERVQEWWGEDIVSRIVQLLEMAAEHLAQEQWCRVASSMSTCDIIQLDEYLDPPSPLDHEDVFSVGESGAAVAINGDLRVYGSGVVVQPEDRGRSLGEITAPPEGFVETDLDRVVSELHLDLAPMIYRVYSWGKREAAQPDGVMGEELNFDNLIFDGPRESHPPLDGVEYHPLALIADIAHLAIDWPRVRKAHETRSGDVYIEMRIRGDHTIFLRGRILDAVERNDP